MNIALFGYGKMGKMIETVSQNKGHNIVAKIDVDSGDIDYSEMDVAIDFSMPDAAFDNISGCFENGVPVISGTTGWLDNYDDAVALCQEKNGAFIYASNFSLGVTIFFELNRYLAQMMSRLDQYRVSLEEIHHTQKLDAPSGTAISLAEDIIENSDYQGWKLDRAGDGEIPVTSKRIGDTPGTHTVNYGSKVDHIEIRHAAHNREGFALGAVIAAEWIQGKTGIFTMKDVLDLNR
ncbi:4-hydroxy-tetrahydrodipicolinate reductase [Pricia sp. S334]|uniref:4-hydroxy-tetrahydrodipicolinate reductase n=1 Tax=Pricia mediterranea TaxID=3076079 RepID=A0ABU3L0W8_9FLAO|nr:4-hydroxy-tetrahydrodipicolinate reductase [Pricia sp. S334]MDT7827360.1 4-hydroxy-tetrahydrodipicolinate reductase [Pricia sp. S334]